MENTNLQDELSKFEKENKQLKEELKKTNSIHIILLILLLFSIYISFVYIYGEFRTRITLEKYTVFCENNFCHAIGINGITDYNYTMRSLIMPECSLENILSDENNCDFTILAIYTIYTSLLKNESFSLEGENFDSKSFLLNISDKLNELNGLNGLNATI